VSFSLYPFPQEFGVLLHSHRLSSLQLSLIFSQKTLFFSL
ncbi:hypothetical protein CCACVL1_04116, partial [Corchorus capsularis]